MEKYIAPLKKAKGLGSAMQGVHHWWWQRLTAIALLILGLWFMVQVFTEFSHATRFHIQGFIGRPWNATFLICLIVAAYYHTWLGLQTIVEDYVHGKVFKNTLLIGGQLLTFLGGVISIFCILSIAFTG